MKFLLISITLILFQVRSVSVNLTDVCQCTTLQAQKDCLEWTKCEWDKTTNKCKAAGTATETGTTTRFISKSCTDTKDCRKTQGCALVEDKDKKQKCVIMGDCQSYLGSSNAECQKYSFRCNWDPKQQTCTSNNVCDQYSGEGKKTDCESVTQQNGESWCKFNTDDNKCRKKECSDYTKTTDAECAASLQDGNCKSDKKKCLTELVKCESYPVEDCLNVITSDVIISNKQCELNKDKTKCQKVSCQGATDSTSDKGCDTYMTGCITNNKECYNKPLPKCQTYSTSDCSSLKGPLGNCILTSGETPLCRDPICEDYQEASDEDCRKKDPTCLYTNGVYCVNQLADKCDSYEPSQTGDCNNLFSKEGKCKSTDQTKCALDKCEEQKLTTNEECAKYSALGLLQSRCITNGVHCVLSLADSCSSIVTNDNACDQFISKEGKCKSKEGSPSICELASCNAQIFTDDVECQKYSSNGIAPEVKCKTDGKKCVDNLKTCNLYLQEEGCSSLKGSDGQCTDDNAADSTKCIVKTCDQITDPSATSCPAGNNSCFFDGVGCIKELKTCESYTSNCDKIISKTKEPCTTNPSDPNKCVKKTCLTAPTSTSSDEQCMIYLLGCVTTGYGCIDKLSTCDTYKGVKSTCEKYIGTDGKCTAEDSNKETDKCKAKDCANATSPTNDTSCNSYSNVCFYNARVQKCSKRVLACDTLKSQTDCEGYLTLETSQFCIWENSKCVQATCNTINNVKSKEGCAVYGANCEYDGLNGCKDKINYTCSTLRSASLCTQDSQLNACLWDTTNKTCIKYNKCSDFALTPAKENEEKTNDQISEETKTCKLLSDKCYSAGGTTCISKVPCTVIKEEKSCLGTIGIDDKVCGYDAKEQACKTFGSCTDIELVTHTECQLYSNTCTSDGKTCVAIKNCSDATNKETCDLGGLDGKCIWSDPTCRLWTCSDATGSTHDACNKLSSSCTTDGTKCMDIGECSTYSDKNCVLGLKNTVCFYDKEKTTCRNKICSDYTNITNQSDCDKVGCAHDPEAKACIVKDKCSLYKQEKTCNNNKSNDNKECVWVEGPQPGCKELATCSDAQKNKAKCEMLNCYYLQANSTSNPPTESQCKNMDCYGKNPSSTAASGCQPFQSEKDGKKNLTFCGWIEKDNKCGEVDPNGIYKEDVCFKLSEYTYYWSTSTSKCTSCKGSITTPPNGNNTTNQTNNTTGNVTDSKGFRLEIAIFIIISFLLI
ncbi:unnamed protein product [Paramecium sonneborni]|uniref:Uncharacterized protein n=1 Tax=Paramecium sonneborni TaxID=65129 RepID=A0A8S1L666_9CILI|nr:unnamed protein product [Paramecium sonneborni]